MPSIKPYDGLSGDRLTDLINLDNSSSLVQGVDFTYGPVTVINGNNGRNTAIDVLPTDTESHSESTVKYIRLPISIMGLLPVGEVDSVDVDALPVTTHDLLPRINAALGLSLTEDEVQNIEYTQVLATYPLTIVDGNIAWLPSTYNFKVNLPGTMLDEDGNSLLTEAGYPFELESA